MQQSNLERQISDLMKKHISNNFPPGVAVAAYLGGASPIQIALAQGLAVLDPSTPATKQTIFELGSITKVFTGTLMAVNFTALNDPVTKYLLDTSDNPALQNVTLQQLATHTSGFPKDVSQKDFPGEHKDGAYYLFHGEAPAADSALLNFWKNWNPNTYSNDCSPCPTGTCWQYSNVGFVTLGYAAAAVAEMNYNQMLQEKITGPLGMPATAAQVPSNFPKAQGYVKGKDGQPVPAKGEAEDLKSNAEDMLKWLAAQLAPPGPVRTGILYAQDTYFLAKNQCAGSKEPTIYNMGLGWQMRPLDMSNPSSPTLYLKDGASGLGGQSCWMGFVGDLNAGVTVLTNAVGAPQKPAYLGHKILELLVGQTVSPEPEELS